MKCVDEIVKKKFAKHPRRGKEEKVPTYGDGAGPLCVINITNTNNHRPPWRYQLLPPPPPPITANIIILRS
jgi:hypothetical protein